jgi:transcriptional regulator with XRE-family HTH domain
MNIQNTFVQMARNYREAKGLLLRQLAVSLVVDTAFMSKMERDKTKVTRIYVEKLPKTLNIPTDDLISIWLSDKLLIALKQAPSAQDAQKLKKKIKTQSN